MKQSLEKSRTTFLNCSGWEKSGVYNFDHAPLWSVRKFDIKAPAAEFAAAEALTSPTKLYAPLIELNANSVDAFTTALAVELSRKHRRVEATYAAQADRVPGSDSETETEEEDNNLTETASLRDLNLPKKSEWNAEK